MGTSLHLLMLVIACGGADDAVARFKRATASSPRDPALHYSLGLALQRGARLAEALHSYDTAVALAAGAGGGGDSLGTLSANALVNSGICLKTLGRLPEAITRYRTAAKASPTDADVLANLGVALQASGDLPGAVAAYRGAVALAGTGARSFGSHFNLAVELKRLGRLPEAIESYGAALRSIKAKGSGAEVEFAARLHASGPHQAAVLHNAGVLLAPFSTLAPPRSGLLPDGTSSLWRSKRAFVQWANAARRKEGRAPADTSGAPRACLLRLVLDWEQEAAKERTAARHRRMPLTKLRLSVRRVLVPPGGNGGTEEGHTYGQAAVRVAHDGVSTAAGTWSGWPSENERAATQAAVADGGVRRAVSRFGAQTILLVELVVPAALAARGGGVAIEGEAAVIHDDGGEETAAVPGDAASPALCTLYAMAQTHWAPLHEPFLEPAARATRVRKIDGVVVSLLQLVGRNYYHWLCEALPRLLLLREAAPEIFPWYGGAEAGNKEQAECSHGSPRLLVPGGSATSPTSIPRFVTASLALLRPVPPGCIVHHDPQEKLVLTGRFVTLDWRARNPRAHTAVQGGLEGDTSESDAAAAAAAIGRGAMGTLSSGRAFHAPRRGLRMVRGAFAAAMGGADGDTAAALGDGGDRWWPTDPVGQTGSTPLVVFVSRNEVGWSTRTLADEEALLAAIRALRVPWPRRQQGSCGGGEAGATATATGGGGAAAEEHAAPALVAPRVAVFRGTERTLREAAAAFGAADIVVGVHGAALSNLVFCRQAAMNASAANVSAVAMPAAPPPVALVEITLLEPMYRHFVHLAAALGVEYWAVDGLGPSQFEASELRIDASAVANTVRAALRARH